MQQANLKSANLRAAVFRKANLSMSVWNDANLIQTELRDAIGLTDEQLVSVKAMHHATMPDGGHYDGRYNLEFDLSSVVASRDPSDPTYSSAADIVLISYQQRYPEKPAEFYEVDLLTYELGQEWARENLPKLRPQSIPDPFGADNLKGKLVSSKSERG